MNNEERKQIANAIAGLVFAMAQRLDMTPENHRRKARSAKARKQHHQREMDRLSKPVEPKK